MVVYLVIITFLLLYMFYWEKEKPQFDTLPFLKKYNRFIIFVTVGILPVVLIFLTVPSKKALDGTTMVKNGEKLNRIDYILEGYRSIAEDNPDDLNAQFDYIDAYTDYSSAEVEQKCTSLSSFYSDNTNRLLINQYIALNCRHTMPQSEDFPEDTTLPGYQYVKGEFHFYNGDYKKAEVAFEDEFQNGTLKKRSYRALYYLAMQDEEQLAELLDRWESIKYLDYYYLKEYYFVNGYPLHYLYNLYYHSYAETSWFTVLIALFVSFIWLYYVRSLDVFDRDKWVHILLVFIISALTTDLCLIIYDLFKHYTSLALYQDTMQDFLYCVVVIGGSEEFIKLLPWVIFVWLSRKANEPYDYILYASVSALGFAFAENLMYYQNYDMQVIVTRALMACVAHMFFASVVAYGYILYKYRYRSERWRWLLPISGFIAACIAHGFYDFWLISPSVSYLSVLTMIFFVISLHIWHTFKNNALNNSVFYNKNTIIKSDVISFFLLVSFIAVLMIEFLIISLKYGHEYGISALNSRAEFVAFFGVYMVSTFGNYKLQRGVWQRIRIPALRRTIFGFNIKNDVDHTGLKLRIFAPKTNVFLGSQLPVTGTCIERIRISGDSDWYIFQLDQTVSFQNYVDNVVAIRHKKSGQNLLDDKIPIYFMMFENALDIDKEHLTTEDLRYMGRAYSRPIE